MGVQEPPPVSVIDIPVRLSLDPLIDAADKALPYQVGHWPGWKDWHGIDTQYRAWRGPLQVSVQGDVILAQAHIRYWARARKDVLGMVSVEGECGVNEPPRQALIGMYARLDWGSDWSLRPQLQLMPTRFLDRCEMTVANIDVTPVVELEFRRQMQDSLRGAMWQLSPAMQAIQRQAERTWSRLSEPVELAADSWLLLRPLGVALSPMRGWGKEIEAQLALALQPVVVSGPRPAVRPTPLPPLGRYLPRSPELSLRLGLDLDFATLGRQLTGALAGQSVEVEGRRGEIATIEVGGSGKEIRARLGLTGELAGTVEMRARLGYDAASHRLELRDLEYDYAADNVALGLLANAFYERTRVELEKVANDALAQHLSRLSERLYEVLRQSLPAGVTVDLSELEWRSVSVSLVERGLRVEGLASGSIRLTLS